ncbi:MAG: lipopolysaccharide biosynthesis protein, partial [Phycisphaerales bacterium]|nr:lipopolysaccharide biosynthesis protein [Phycisphaerales bacterium]
MAQCLRQAIALLTKLVLARLLAPDDFGLFAMLLVVTGFVELTQDMGTSAVVVSARQRNQPLFSTLFWINVITGLVLAAVVALAAPLIAAVYAEPRIAGLCRAAAVLFVLNALVIVPRAVLSRRLRLDVLARVELIAATLGAAAAIAVAIAGGGVWSLLAQPVVASSVAVIMIWRRVRWRPSRQLDWTATRGVRRYTAYLSGFTVLDYLHLNGDNFLIGLVLGAQDLGVYAVAYLIAVFPANTMVNVVCRVLFPYHARVRHDDAHVRRTFLTVVRASALVVFPAIIGLAAVGDLFATVVLGPEWATCGVVLVLLTPVALGKVVAATTGPIYQVTGRTDLMFRWGVRYLLVTLLAFAIGVQWGVKGVAAAYSMTLLVAWPIFSVPFGLIGIRLRDLGHVIARPLALCVVMAGVVVGVKTPLVTTLGPASALALLVVIGVAVYAGLVATMGRGDV